MTVTTVTIQKCDRCKDERELNKNEKPELGGWREIASNKHLCPNCIHVILEEGK